LEVLTGSGTGAPAALAQETPAGVLVSPDAATLPSTATSATVYELALWLLTRTPYAPVTGWGPAVELACAVGEAFGVGDPGRDEGEWPAALLAVPPHATPAARASKMAAARHGLPGVETRGCVPISKRNAIVHVGLRFPVPSTL
jgi:hypothetical protein